MDKLNQYEKQSCKVIWFILFIWIVLCSFNFSLKRHGVSLRLSHMCGKKWNRWFCWVNLMSLSALVLCKDFKRSLKTQEELVFCKFWWVSISTGTSQPLHFYTLHTAGKWVSPVLNPEYSVVLSEAGVRTSTFLFMLLPWALIDNSLAGKSILESTYLPVCSLSHWELSLLLSPLLGETKVEAYHWDSLPLL